MSYTPIFASNSDTGSFPMFAPAQQALQQALQYDADFFLSQIANLEMLQAPIVLEALTFLALLMHIARVLLEFEATYANNVPYRSRATQPGEEPPSYWALGLSPTEKLQGELVNILDRSSYTQISQHLNRGHKIALMRLVFKGTIKRTLFEHSIKIHHPEKLEIFDLLWFPPKLEELQTFIGEDCWLDVNVDVSNKPVRLARLLVQRLGSYHNMLGYNARPIRQQSAYRLLFMCMPKLDTLVDMAKITRALTEEKQLIHVSHQRSPWARIGLTKSHLEKIVDGILQDPLLQPPPYQP
tara:strand:- start:373 stop:1263 length:891 start_codon:yes stop_codon:yes gene_type:complete